MSTKTGVVISAGLMMKTVKVQVAKTFWHSHLRKSYQRHEKFMAHDENGACVAGDVVRIVPNHKSTKHKRHVVSEIVSSFRTGEPRKPVETVEEWEARKQQKHEAKLLRRGKIVPSRGPVQAAVVEMQANAGAAVRPEAAAEM